MNGYTCSHTKRQQNRKLNAMNGTTAAAATARGRRRKKEKKKNKVKEKVE